MNSKAMVKNPDLLRLLPPITRARGFRLYSGNGKRFVDLFRENGRLFLGHRPQGQNKTLKNELDRGLVPGLPSIFEPRLRKTLSRLFPAYEMFVITGSLSAACTAASEYLGEKVVETSIVDPLFTTGEQVPRVSLWRPFSQSNLETEVLLPVLPFQLGGGPVVLCFKKQKPVTDTGPVSPILLAGALHCLGLLSRTNLPPWCVVPIAPDNPVFRQKGIYLIPQCDDSAYEKVFRDFLERGFLLAPRADLPSLLPLEMSEGELSMIKLLLRAAQ